MLGLLLATFFSLGTCSTEPAVLLDGNIFFSRVDGGQISVSSYRDREKAPEARPVMMSAQGVSEKESFEILCVIPGEKGEYTVFTRRHGVFLVREKGKFWERIDSGLPREVVYPFADNGLTKPVMSLSVSDDLSRVAVLFSHALYLSTDGGKSYARTRLEGVYSSSELLSVSWHPKNRDLLVLGTSFSGIFISRDGGASWVNRREGIPGEPAASPAEIEEVRSLCWSDTEQAFFVGLGNGQGLIKMPLENGRAERLHVEDLVTYPDGDFYSIDSLHYYRGSLLAATDRGKRIVINEKGPEDGKAPGPDAEFLKQYVAGDLIVSFYADSRVFPVVKKYMPVRTFQPDKKVMGRRALYISYTFTQQGNYDKLLVLLRELNLNAVVINMKDDSGYIRSPSTDPVLAQVKGNISPYINLRETIERFKKDGIYVIGRFVVFKDDLLFAYDNYKYAAKTINGNPLPKGPEHWVDPYSEFVWEYNIRAARAVLDSGVDEIQFDYIRFPDRVSLETTKYDFQRDGMIMREALESFLKRARETITAPISIDLFGYMAIYKAGNSIGQDLPVMARYVDVVSPMFYPSHFSSSFAAGFGSKQIYYLMLISCKRAKELMGGAYLRPYIQAFYYKSNWYNYGPDYIGWELDAIKASGNGDFIFWNNLVEYSVLIGGMKKYLGANPAAGAATQAPKKLPFDSVLEY